MSIFYKCEVCKVKDATIYLDGDRRLCLDCYLKEDKSDSKI